MARTAVQERTMATTAGVDDVRPPTQAVMAKHGAQDQLHVEHENRENGQREKRGAALVEFGAGMHFHPATSGEDGD